MRTSFVLVLLASLFLVCVLGDKTVRNADGALVVQFSSSGDSGSILVSANQTRTSTGAIINDDDDDDSEDEVSGDSNDTEDEHDGEEKLKRSFEIRWEKIEEVTSTGDVVQDASGYAVDADLWQGPMTVSVNGVSAQRVYLNNTLAYVDGDASIAITALIFSQAASIANGAELLSVPANSLKLTIGIRNWPFRSSNNGLAFGLELKFDSHSEGEEQEDSDIDDDKQQRLAWGGAALDVATNAVIDGVLTPIQTKVEKESGKTTITFSFPHFNSDVVYDPTVSFQPMAAKSSAAGLAPSFALLASLLTAVVVSARKAQL